MKRKRVCILMSLTGGGHRSVATAIADAARRTGGLEASIHDPFAEGSSSTVDRVVKMYAPIIVRFAFAWSLIYHGSDNTHVFSALMRIADIFHHHKLRRIVDVERPDVVISVHPLCNHLTLSALAAARSSAPLITVVTELVTVHASWAAHGTAAFVAATEMVERGLIARGACPERIRVLGLPIDERFGRVQADPAEVRIQLGLRPDLTTVLLSGGGEGAGPFLESVEAVSTSKMPVQLLVVCGRNQHLFDRLNRMRFNVPVKVLGFVDNMPELVHAADVVALKAGSVSIAEAIVSRRPVVVLRELPGQEKGNSELVRRNHLGAVARTPSELVRVLAPLVSDPQLRQRLGQNCAPLLSPCAATNVARLALEL